MSLHYDNGKQTIYCGDNLALLRGAADAQFDALVSDPPYGLSFMGNRWDYDVPSVEFWREALRVLKPGAPLLVFAGSRTFHRMAVNMEEAGAELRDTLSWIYGTGFPKSLDISKAIDKLDAKDEQRARRLRFTAWVRGTGVTAGQLDAATGTQMGGHYTAVSSQPQVMTREHLEACRPLLGAIPAWVEAACDQRTVESKNFAAREVVGAAEMRDAQALRVGCPDVEGNDGAARKVVDITAPATDAAKLWHGWGTALKPAWEPILLAMKPLDGTFAENALAHGVAGLHLDACRIGVEQRTVAGPMPGDFSDNPAHEYGMKGGSEDRQVVGRHPANLLLDEVAAAQLYAQSGREVSRFFFVPKPTEKDKGYYNPHSTVKPTKLMEYLLHLVETPTGGAVLDPFMGSGTTLVAAARLGRECVGMELNEAYCVTAARRIREELAKASSTATEAKV